MLLDRPILGLRLREQFGWVGPDRAGERDELMKRDPLMPGLDVGERGATHAHRVRDPLL